MKRRWQPEELIEHFTLLPAEYAILPDRRAHTRLGFAVLLKCFQYEGRFPSQTHEVPSSVVACLAQQMDVPADQLRHYAWKSRTVEAHRAQIREFLGFRRATVQDADALMIWLSEHIAPQTLRDAHLKEAAYQRLQMLQIEPPTPDRLDRIIGSALSAFEERLCAQVMAHLSSTHQAQLDALLAPGESITDEDAEQTESDRTPLNMLKQDTGPVGLDRVLTELHKLTRLRQGDLPSDLFLAVSPKVLHRYYQRAVIEPPRELRRHRPALRYTILAAFCWLRQQDITDQLVELLILIVHRIDVRAEKRVITDWLEDLRRVDGKTSILFKLAEAAVQHPDGIIREVLYPVTGEQILQDLVREYRATGASFRTKVHTRMQLSYRTHYRRMIPHVLQMLDFRTNNTAYQPVMAALDLVNRYANIRVHYYPDHEEIPIDSIIPSSLHELVCTPGLNGQTRVHRLAYELCALQALRDQLRCREIWVSGANRYRNPDADLPQDFEIKRETYYAELHQPMDAEVFTDRLQQTMTQALTELDAGLPRNPSVTILPRGTGWIRLSPLKAQPEPTHLKQLKVEISARWPMTGLLDILKEAELRMAFTEPFRAMASREGMDAETLQKRLLLCLYAVGTNLGIKRVSAGDHGERYDDLVYVKRRYLHKEPLREAITRVVNAIFQTRQDTIWGEATTSCASDSTQFGAWDQNLMTEWHQRYGGRGVMIYWHVETQASCIYSQLKRCSSSEVAAMIEGVLRHCTDMAVEKQYVDSHGQSHVAFAFCHLLGFHLLPRLKGIHAQKLYRPQSGQPEAFLNLQPILTRPINWALIRQQYDAMIKYATALRLGTADAQTILSRFTRQNVQHPTYQALSELGKAVKTIFLSQYLHSEALRTDMQEGLNVIELWNQVNDFIFFGKGGEIATNRHDEQELAMLCLHLLQNCLVYVNTLMIQRVLTDPVWIARLSPDDLRGLTPLFYTHVNPYGRFQLDMNARLDL